VTGVTSNRDVGYILRQSCYLTCPESYSRRLGVAVSIQMPPGPRVCAIWLGLLT
jgi:hypothetical protein